MVDGESDRRHCHNYASEFAVKEEIAPARATPHCSAHRPAITHPTQAWVVIGSFRHDRMRVRNGADFRLNDTRTKPTSPGGIQGSLWDKGGDLPRCLVAMDSM